MREALSITKYHLFSFGLDFFFFFKVRKWVLAAGTHQVKGVWPKPGPSRDTAFWKSNSVDVTTGWRRQGRGGRIPHGTGTSRWRPSRVGGGGPGEATTQPLRVFGRLAHLPAPPRRGAASRSPSPSARGEAKRRRDGGLTGSLGADRRGRPMLGGPAAGVARSRLPQVVLEAHLPSFAAAPAAAETPQAAGRAPQQPAALAGERGQVVHAAARRHGSPRAAAAARQRPPSLPSRGRRLRACRRAARAGPPRVRGGPLGRSSGEPAGSEGRESAASRSRAPVRAELHFEKF